MTQKRIQAERFSLARWSQRKLESTRTRAAPAEVPAAAPSAPTAPAAAAPATTSVSAPAPSELPPVESLTFDSDFTAFLRPEVDPDLKRAALKQLFRDPRFNVMDGLDVYIDDYTRPDPIPADMLTELVKRFDFDEAAPAAAADRGEAESGAPASPAAQAPRIETASEAAVQTTGGCSHEAPPPAPAEIAHPSAPEAAASIEQGPAPLSQSPFDKPRTGV